MVELLETICAGKGAAKCVTAVYAFGSWSRGALEVGDVDIDIEYDDLRDPETRRQMFDAVLAARDPLAVLRKALKPRRTLQVLFESADNLGQRVLIYKDGDNLEAALARVHSIELDADAGRAEREAVHPALEPVANALTRPSLIRIGELAAHGLIDVVLIDLPDFAVDEIADTDYREFVQTTWSESSPLARAARAGGALMLGRGLEPVQLLVLGRSPEGAPDQAKWAIEAREGKLRNVAYDLGHGLEGWLYVVRPERRQPLRALEITAPVGSSLRDDEFDLDAWLLENAPHIQRIG